jgi:uncharacterized membrane protein
MKEGNMYRLIVLTFDNTEEAGEVRESLSKAEKGGYVSLDDSAVVIKDENGEIHVKNEVDRGVKVGAVGGSTLGLFIGFLFGGPIGAMIVGGLGGAAIGSMADLGVDKTFVKEVSDALKPGTSALFLIFRGGKVAVALGALKPYKGEIYHTNLTPEMEDQLRRALRSREE